MGVKGFTTSGITYFDVDGRSNLRQVLRLVQRARSKRADLTNLKVVFLTGFCEGPLLATRIFKENRPKMIAVTFPPTTKIGEKDYVIAPEVLAYLRAMDVDIVSNRLPFDGFDGTTVVDQQMRLLKSTLGIFGRSMPLCVQAVLQACDVGLILEGETVIAITGDMAAIVNASTTVSFLAPNSAFSINEFICKPRRRTATPTIVGPHPDKLLPPVDNTRE